MDFICQQLLGHKLLSLFHLPHGCSVHVLSKVYKKSLIVKPYLSARGSRVAQRHPFVLLRGDPPFCLLILFHFAVDESVVSNDMLEHLILEHAGTRGKAQPVAGEGRDGGGKGRERVAMRPPHQKAESFWCTKYI